MSDTHGATDDSKVGKEMKLQTCPLMICAEPTCSHRKQRPFFPSVSTPKAGRHERACRWAVRRLINAGDLPLGKLQGSIVRRSTEPASLQSLEGWGSHETQFVGQYRMDVAVVETLCVADEAGGSVD